MRDSFARSGGVEYVESHGTYIRRIPIITEDGGTAYAPITPQGLALPLHTYGLADGETCPACDDTFWAEARALANI